MSSISRKIVSGWQVLVTGLACVVVLFTAGCGDECKVGDLRCNGDALQICVDEGDVLFSRASWVDQECAGVCRDAKCVPASASFAEVQAPLACVLNLAR
jgi:hypothetical protein